MKKKLIAILTVLIMTVSALAGCSTSFSKIKFKAGFEHDFSDKNVYNVVSNGGNAVQFGQFVYFINGTRGYEDSDGKQNRWGEVVKGGLYKAKLLDGGQVVDRNYVANINEDTNLVFKSDKGVLYTDSVNEDLEDADKEIIDIVDVQLVASKVIGTSGYSNGGIFIYDDYVYYATPNNNLNKSGNVQVDRTDFMRTKLDGSLTQLIFTTEGVSSNLPYAFYKQGASVYLVCYYDTTVVSVEIKDNSTKIGKAMIITEDATSVLLPTRDVYNASNNVTNDPEDFIYFTRNITEDDYARTGNVVEVARPNGSENFTLFMTGKNITLEAVSGGGLFYRTTNALGNDIINFDNLHDALMGGVDYKDGNANSPSYANYENSLVESDTVKKRVQVTATAIGDAPVTDYTSMYFFRDNLYANKCYIIGFTASAVYLLSNGGGSMRILNRSASLEFVRGTDLYFLADGKIYRTDYTVSDTSKGEPVLVSDHDVVSGGFKSDFVANMIMYFADIDEWAKSYAYFKNVIVEGAEAKEVYERAEADHKPDEE